LTAIVYTFQRFSTRTRTDVYYNEILIIFSSFLGLDGLNISGSGTVRAPALCVIRCCDRLRYIANQADT